MCCLCVSLIAANCGHVITCVSASVCVCVSLTKKSFYLTISSGKQALIALICSCRTEPGSAWISCTFFSPPLVTNRRRALLSCGSTCDRSGSTVTLVGSRCSIQRDFHFKRKTATLLNWQRTCLRMLLGASNRRGSSPGRNVHFCSMVFKAVLLWNWSLAFSYIRNFANS